MKGDKILLKAEHSFANRVLLTNKVKSISTQGVGFWLGLVSKKFKMIETHSEEGIWGTW